MYRLPHLRCIKKFYTQHNSLKPLFIIPNSSLVVAYEWNSVEIVDIRAPSKRISLTTGNVTCVGYLPNNNSLVTCGSTKGIHFWSLTTTRLNKRLFEKNLFSNFTLIPKDNCLIATSQNTGDVWIIDMDDEKIISKIKGPKITGIIRSYNDLKLLSIYNHKYLVLKGNPVLYFGCLSSSGFLVYRLPDDNDYKNIQFLREYRIQKYIKIAIIEEEGMMVGFGYSGDLYCRSLVDNLEVETKLSCEDFGADIKYCEAKKFFTITSNRKHLIHLFGLKRQKGSNQANA